MTDAAKEFAAGEIMAQLTEEFLGNSQHRMEILDACIQSLSAGDGDQAEHFIEFQREVHNLKGSGGTFGFPAISLISHRLEDYISAAGHPNGKQLGDWQIFVDRMSDIIDDGVNPTDEATKNILRALPAYSEFDPSDVRQRDVEVLLVIPSRAIRQLVSRELQACGYRVITAKTPSLAFDIVVNLRPDMIITSAVLDPISGIDLINAFAAMTLTEAIPIAVLTSFAHSHHDLQDLPDSATIIRLDDHLEDDLATVITDFELRLGEAASTAAGKA